MLEKTEAFFIMTTDIKQIPPTQSNIAILVVSCDSYQDLWHPFFHLFFKYWQDCPYPVYLGSNCIAYPDPRVTSILVGQDLDYSSNLLKMLASIVQDWVILWIEDRFVSEVIDTRHLMELVSLAQRQQVGYLKLIANHPFAFSTDDSQEIGEIPKGVPYRVGATVGLWHKSVLLELLRPGETAWDIERLGSTRSGEIIAKFFSLTDRMRNTPPILDVHGIIKGRWAREALGFLRQEGLQDCIPHRQVQSMRSVLYVKAYLFAMNIFHAYRKFRWYISLNHD